MHVISFPEIVVVPTDVDLEFGLPGNNAIAIRILLP
jgi:hypothetical protein